MPNVILVGLTGTNVLTATNPDLFALFADQSVNHILIKEKARGTSSVVTGGSGTNIAHGLSYVPHCLASVETSAGVWRKLYSTPLDASGFWFEINATNLVLRNTSGSTKTFAFFIFYDNIT